jgi:hypothetical protein
VAVHNWKIRRAAARKKRELAIEADLASTGSHRSVYKAGVARRFFYGEVPEQALARGPIYLISIMGHRYLTAKSARVARVHRDEQEWFCKAEFYPNSDPRWADALDKEGRVSALVLNYGRGRPVAVPIFMVSGFESVLIAEPNQARSSWPGIRPWTDLTLVHLHFLDMD